MLSSDPALKIMKPKLIGSLRGPISAPIQTSNLLDAIRRLMELLQSAGFAAGDFDAQTLLECDHDQVIQAGRALFAKLVPLTGEYDSGDRAIPNVADIPKGYHTGSSQYLSAESEVESDMSINIERMSLGPAGMASVQQNMDATGSGQLSSYFEAAMKKYEQDRARLDASRPAIPRIPQEVSVPDVEMESVGSHHTRSSHYDMKDLRRPLKANARNLT